ncbi:MAG: pyruvate-formate lyase, partial [Actinobacteria bacterium]|nr:pyruvate-formate lyase [Actinomycetota bacterium]
MLSPRLSKIKDRMFNYEMVTKKEWWGHDKTILDEPGILDESLVVRKAKAIEYVCKNLPVEIKPDELIVGNPNMAAVGFGYTFPQYANRHEKEAAAKKCLNESSVWGHTPVRYDKLLSLGLKGFRSEVIENLRQELFKPNPDAAKVTEYRAMIISLNAVREFANRYSELALKMAESEKDITRRLELLKISDRCSKVPEEPSTSFHEALQSFWLTYAVYHSCMEYLPAGRADQYFYPYYKYDIENKVISQTEAKDVIGSMLAKFNERVQVRKELWEDHYTFGNFSQGGDPIDPSTHLVLDDSSSYNYGLSANHWLMNMILGGQDAYGNDATNELTYLILNTWAELEVVAPVMSVRF